MSAPASYLDASWRCTLPYDAARKRIGIGIDLADGTTLRVALDAKSALALADTLRNHLHIARGEPPPPPWPPQDDEFFAHNQPSLARRVARWIKAWWAYGRTA